MPFRLTGSSSVAIRMRLRDVIAGALLALCATATPPCAEPADLVNSAFLASSDALRLRVLGTALEAGRLAPRDIALMRRDLLAQGYGGKRGQPEITARRLSFAPIFGWDGNINGGVLQDRLTIGGMVLEADPAFRAKSGLVFGGSVAAMSRLAWDEGRVIEVSAGAELAWSPRHEIGRADAMISLCSRNHLKNWTFLDLCALGTRSWRDLDTGNARRLSAGLSKIFAGAGGVQEVGIRYDSVTTSGAMQDRVHLSLERVGPAGVFDAALTLGAPVSEVTVLRQRYEAGFSWTAMGRDWRGDLWHQRADGGMFLGIPREDRSQGFGLTVSRRPGISARLGVMSSRSSAAIADYDQITFDIRFNDLLR